MADPLATEILTQLIRKGALDLSDVEAMAHRLEEDGEEDAAHRARSALIESGVDREAERDNVVMIRRMKLGPVSDGGNDPA
ncbi:MAG TPA: hypothetical protein VM760_08825 [Sphingomicrobium sp.]|nr:hypothetical protein [Sphingomicrobium sp.]